MSKMKKTFINDINIHDGVITFNDMDIDESIPFEQQKYSYKEDMLQIKFGDRFILDVGWRPDFKPEGHFVIQVIQDYDWMNPISKTSVHDWGELKKSIEGAILIIHEMKKDKNLPDRNPFKD